MGAGVNAACLLALLACGCAPENHGRLVILGMDGLEYTMLDRMGTELPNFHRILTEGARGEMHIPPPIMSPIVWTIIASGYPPEIHGVGGWTNGHGQPFTGADVRVLRTWDALSALNRRSIVSGWLMTWPASPIHGSILSDKFAWSFPMNKDQDATPTAGTEDGWAMTYPDALGAQAEALRPDAEWLDKSVVGYQIRAYGAPYHPLARDETHVRVFEALWPTADADLGALYLNGADQVSHLYWPFTDPGNIDIIRADPKAHARAAAVVMLQHPERRPPPFSEGIDASRIDEAGRWVPDYYRYLDGVLGRVFAKLDADTTLILCSDHGFKVSTAQPLINGSHHDIAVFTVWGPQAKAGARADIEVFDAAPTIHALLGLAPAADWTGRVADALVDVAPLPAVPTYRLQRAAIDLGETAGGGEADKQLLEQLEALGYIGEDGQPDPAIGASRKQR